VTHLLETYGLALLFLLITLESGGIPLPGETALITTSILASRGHFHGIVPVIVVAAAAAIIGDNGGYWAARLGAMRLIRRSGRLSRFADRVLPPSERFFERHGGKTVFFARFIAILRFTAAWLAGLSKMSWWRFLLWNAAGGIAWAAGVGLLAYYTGHAAADAIDRYGYVAAGAIVVLVVAGFFGLRAWKKRVGLEGEKA
jgi:membrane protein DedA with SNARE-associated domain